MSAAVADSRPRFLTSALAGLGGYALTQAQLVGQWAMLWVQASRYVLKGALDRKQIIEQVAQIGVGSLVLAAITVTFSSMVLALYTTDQFIEYGFVDKVGFLISASIVREGGPVLVAIVVASREGSAIAAELASMKVTEQIDALRSLATDPVSHLVVPRYVAMLLAMPLLTILAGTAGVCGGYLIAHSHGVPTDVYWSSAARGVEMFDLFTGFIKALVFGAVVAIVSCHQGLTAGHGAEAVGRSTTASVVLCIVLVHFMDFALVTVFNS